MVILLGWMQCTNTLESFKNEPRHIYTQARVQKKPCSCIDDGAYWQRLQQKPSSTQSHTYTCKIHFHLDVF